MTKKIFAVVLLSLAFTACESGGTDNANGNNAVRPNTNSQATPTPMAMSSPEVSPSTALQLKAGDKVKVTTNGSSTAATVISVDEKAGKVTVKIPGQKEDKTVAISDIVKQ